MADQFPGFEEFQAYFVKNYPGPDTVIFDPKWHAPKLYRAAVSAFRSGAAGVKPIAHLVWKQGLRAADDVEDYYEVARPGDKSVDGSEPFPVYAALAAVPGEPVGVKVKPLEWKDHSDGIYDRGASARSILGPYEAFVFTTIGKNPTAICGWNGPGTYDKRVSSFEAAKAGAEADYEQRILSALTPHTDTVERMREGRDPVSNMRGLEATMDEVWNAAVEQAAAIAKDCVHLTPDPDAAIMVMLNGRAKLHPASQAALQPPAPVQGGEGERRG